MKLTRLLLFFLFGPIITHAQNHAPPNIDSLAKYFLKYAGSFDKEKILLQTDKHIYLSGQTIYFKAFPIDSIANQLRGKPKKLYVDLVNTDDKVIGQLLLNASNLKTSGEFVLNDSLKEGYYWIRAYTKKMIIITKKRKVQKCLIYERQFIGMVISLPIRTARLRLIFLLPICQLLI